MRNLFILCKDKHKFVFEISNYFGNRNELTVEESEYWFAFEIIETAKHYKIDYEGMVFDDIISEIKKEKNRQEEKYAENRS